MIKLNEIKPILSDLYPLSWRKQLKDTGQQVDIMEFNNIQHFKQHLAQLKLNDKGAADNQKVKFKPALDELIAGVPVINPGNFKTIKDQVRTVLQKKGLISENIYEGYQYDVEGDIVDIAKYVSGDPECMLKPKVKYKGFFYELFISGAYLSGVADKTVADNVSKILATIQLLEQERIYIKVTIVTASTDVVRGKVTQVVAVPLFSHKDEKTIESMSSILNERFFRTFIFGIKEDSYGKTLDSGYGRTINLNDAVRLNNVNVEKLATSILDKVITPGTR